MSATTASPVLTQHRKQGAAALLVLKLSLAGCALALLGTLGSVAWKVIGF